MPRLLAIVAALGLALPQTACIVVTKNKSQPAARSTRCKPSHYWDGHKCRHKGRGKGARKHDY